MRLTVLLAAALCIAACDQSSSVATASERFEALLETHWQQVQRENVYFRGRTDAWREDGTLPDFTAAARERRQAFNDSLLDELEAIDPAELEPDERLSYTLFRYERLAERDSYEQIGHRFPFTSLGGYHTAFALAPDNMPFLVAADYERYLTSLGEFSRINDEQIDNMREAIANGSTHYCGSIGDYATTIERHIVDAPRDSELFAPFSRFPGILSDAQRRDFTERGLALIEDQVVPSYRSLLTFFNEEYLPNCRPEPGLSSIPGGEDYYRYLVGYFTTTDMTPEAIHALGLSEMKRVREDMQAVIDAVGFTGSFSEFLEYLRTEPSFYPQSLDELMQRTALICKRADGALPRFFGLLPRTPYKLRPNPYGGASYAPSAGDGATSGTYFVAADDLASRPLYTLEVLSLHEAVPGHHLQIAIAMELDLPPFRRNLFHGAYVEGWGLYSESIGTDMGFYTDPYSEFGRLTFSAWRAARLVVDTGIHAKGWSRQEAVDYLLNNTGLTEMHANKEIDRYITYPGQALGYKIGEIKIRELRALAEETLGENFDIRAFHDTVLGSGSVPIEILEDTVNRWIKSEKQR